MNDKAILGKEALEWVRVERRCRRTGDPFGGLGGYIAGSAGLIDAHRSYARECAFATALSLSSCAASASAIKYLKIGTCATGQGDARRRERARWWRHGQRHSIARLEFGGLQGGTRFAAE